jgi:hypothetical protein
MFDCHPPPQNKYDWIDYSLNIIVNGDVALCFRGSKGEEVMKIINLGS